MLNTTQHGNNLLQNSHSRLLMNKSVYSNRTIQFDFNDKSNILDDLNLDKKFDLKLGLPQLLSKLHQELRENQLQKLTAPVLRDFMAKLKATMETVAIEMDRIGFRDQKEKSRAENQILGEELQGGRNPLSNYQFHQECLGQFQSKMKQLEGKFNIVDLMIQQRGLGEQELKELRVEEILVKNKALNQEDFELNAKELSNIELVRLLEGNFEEKTKIFEAKKKFMIYIRKIKEDQLEKLKLLFDKLNRIEDEY